MTMRESLRVLLIEDSEDDAVLTLRALNSSFQVTYERVESAEGMIAALKNKPWDIIVSDYNMPRFSGTDAFLILKATDLILPFILVSGAMGEETAVEAMRVGVDDYILKGNLARLVPAVRRELQRVQVFRERKSAEEERDHFFSSSLDMLCISGTDGYFIRLNPAFETILGHTAQELMTKPIVGFVHPEDISTAEDEMGKIASGNKVMSYEVRHLCRDGSYKWLSWSGSLAGGRIYAMARDVTEKRNVAETLRIAAQMQEAVANLGQFALQGASLVQVYERAVQLSAQLFDTRFCSLLTLLPDGKTLRVSASMGWDEDVINARYQVSDDSHTGFTFMTKKPVFFGDASQETRFRQSKGMIDAGIVSGLTVIIGNKDNQFGVLGLHSKVVNKFGLKEVSFLQGIANIVATVIERSHLEAQLNTSDRMATVGQLAAGVAHEINNPLSYITANLEMIATEVESLERTQLLEKTESLLKMLAQTQEGVERVRIVVKDLTTFSRSSEDKLESIHLEKVIDSSIRMTTSQIRHRAKLVKNVSAAPFVKTNEGRMGQVILNLLINAYQSIPEGDPAKNEIQVNLFTNENGDAVVEITDTGTGIPPEILPSIFDPFFTTKAIGVGTGLGLSICRNIVLKMHGDLTVTSRVGLGTTVRVVLPAAAEQTLSLAEASVLKVDSVADKNLRLKILLVDDEKALVMAMARGLTNAHEVLTTTSPLEALAMIDREKILFDVIFCDLMMEEMTGMDFYDEVCRRFPSLESRIIFMTGGVFSERARVFLETVPNLRLMKPFRLNEIRDLLQADLTIGSVTPGDA
jgi:PAS domain S-box-containing protein